MRPCTPAVDYGGPKNRGVYEAEVFFAMECVPPVIETFPTSGPKPNKCCITVGREYDSTTDITNLLCPQAGGRCLTDYPTNIKVKNFGIGPDGKVARGQVACVCCTGTIYLHPSTGGFTVQCQDPEASNRGVGRFYSGSRTWWDPSSGWFGPRRGVARGLRPFVRTSHGAGTWRC